MIASLMRTILIAGAAGFLTASTAIAANLPTKQDSRLLPVFKSDRLWNAVTITSDGRVFVGYPSSDRPGIQIAELSPKGSASPYPDKAWNIWKPGEDPKAAFVRVNALRIGPDGALWVVDAGATGIGKPAVPGGARIIRFDLATNSVARIYPLADAIRPTSYVDDIRFNGERAYITDAGAPGLIVLDLNNGNVRRVLDNHPSTVDQRAMRADGRVLRDENGKELRIHADQLEVSPDGQYLYYQPSSGPLSRIATRWLDDPAVSSADLASHVEENWAATPTTGGTAIDASGTIYLSDTDHRSILKIAPDGKISTLIEDPRLIWSDAMWIDNAGFLWIPATQQNLTPGFNGGRLSVKYPVRIYKMQIGAKPAANDHP